MMTSLSATYLKTIVLIIFICKISWVTAVPTLLVSNNGPATLGASIVFNATVVNYEVKSKLLYTFDDGIQKLELSVESRNVSETLVFPQDKYKEGIYCMTINVEVSELFWEKQVASNRTCFGLQRGLVGKIYIHRDNVTSDDDIDEVAVGENVTIILDLYDPNKYLQNAVIDFGWSIDMERHQTLNNTLIYNFTDPGIKQIDAIATAEFPNNENKLGIFEKMINAKIPVNTVNISGNPFLKHGDMLLLNVSCSGTPPFVYCSEILKSNTSVENFTCSQPATFTTCHMEIRKFLHDGKHHMGIYISNDVKEVKRILEIMVYNVTIKPTLSTVIIPIVCSLLTLVIIAMGISYCVRQRNQLAVEVANFDFQDDSDSYTERTFFEKIFDSFTCRNCRNPQFSCIDSRSESDPLLHDEHDPLV